MAKEYIEREAATAYAPLPKHLREYQTMNLDDAWEDGYDFAIRQLSSIPATDVVEVVRCKDCVHYDKGENDSEAWEYCKVLAKDVYDNFYCKLGKKREVRHDN